MAFDRRGKAIALLFALGAASTVSWPSGGRARAATTAPGNLLSGAAATFDGGLAGWACSRNCAVQVVSTPVQSGTGALQIHQLSATGTDEWVMSGTSPSTYIPAKPGVVYSGGGSFAAGGPGRPLAPVLGFYDASGNLVASTFGPAVTDGPVWTSTSTVTGLAPTNAASLALGFVLGGAAEGEDHFLDNAYVTARPGAAPAVLGPLHTAGNQILDSSGHRVVLRGLTRTGTQAGSSTFPSDAEIAAAKAWGANFIRVPLGEQLWLNTCPMGLPSDDPTYPSRVDNEVGDITSRGMLALLDLHFNVISPCGRGNAHRMADASYSLPFWRQVARRYANNPLVAFDLYNEPHDISDAVWLNGGFVQEGLTWYNAAGMRQLYDAVRQQGANNLVFITGPVWGARPPWVPVAGFNTVNAAHIYTCGTLPPPACGYPNATDPSPILNQWLQFKSTGPIMVTEFGWPDANDGTYNANVIAFAERQGWGWAVFAWDGSTDGRFDLLLDNAGFEPSLAGQPVLAGLAADVPSGAG
jgi:hypothetical protein